MSIRLDPLTTPPFHALSRRDVQDALDSIPPEWRKYARRIRLGTTLPEHGRFQRPAMTDEYGWNFLLYCRGLTPERAFREMLVEIAAYGIGTGFQRGHALTTGDIRTLRQVVDPIVVSLVRRKTERDQDSAVKSILEGQ